MSNPEELTDAEAEAFIRYLTQTPERKRIRRKMINAFIKTPYGKNLLANWKLRRK